MIYHVMGSSPYLEKYVNLLKARPDFKILKDHVFIAIRRGSFKICDEYLEGLNYHVCERKWEFLSFIRKTKASDLVILHGLFNPRLILYMAISPRFCARCVWSIWGADAYFLPIAKANKHLMIVEWLRRLVIPRIPYITAMIEGDFNYVIETYGAKAKYTESFYQSPIDFLRIPSTQRASRCGKTVLLGNSGDPFNNHSEALSILADKDDGQFRIICPLSYGDKPYMEGIIALGRSLFGNRFEPLTTFMNEDQYVAKVSSVDVGIMNHSWQMGLGNIALLLALGKKVYCRKESSVYRYFRDKGIDLNEFSQFLSIDELFSSDRTTSERNSQIIRELFDDERFYSTWEQVFRQRNGLYES